MKLTVSEAIHLYSQARMSDVSQETLRSYLRVFAKARASYGHQPVLSVKDWLAPWDGSKSGAKRHAANILRAVQRFHNLPLTPLPKHKTTPHPRLPAEQLYAAMNAGQDDIAMAYQIGLGFGLRIGDLANLRPSDYWDGMVHVRTSKTGVDLDFTPTPDIEAFFLAKAGQNWLIDLGEVNDRTSALRRQMAKRRKEMKMTGVVHSLRKTAACIAAEENMSDSAIQALLGHKTPKMAAYYRAQMMASSLRKTAQEAVMRRLDTEQAGRGWSDPHERRSKESDGPAGGKRAA